MVADGFLGIVLGLSAVAVLGVTIRVAVKRGRNSRWDAARREEQLALAAADLAAAISEEPDAIELRRPVLNLAMKCCGALSACWFEVVADGELQGVVMEGLFPPLGKRGEPLPPTRAGRIERVFRSGRVHLGDGLIGRVAAQLRTEAEPPVSQRKSRRAAASGTLAVIAAPVQFDGRLLGVLAVAHPEDGLRFSADDRRSLERLVVHAAPALERCGGRKK